MARGHSREHGDKPIRSCGCRTSYGQSHPWLKSDTQTYTDTGFTTPAVANNDNVAGWKDQSGNSNNVITQSTRNAAVLKTNIQNGFPGIYFPPNGTHQGLSGLQGAFTWGQPKHIFIAMKTNEAWGGSGGYIFDGQSANSNLLQTSGTGNKFDIYAGTFLDANDTFANNTSYVLEALINGASSLLRLNAGTAGSGNAGAGTSNGITIGNSQPTTLPHGYSMYIFEILGYSAALSTGDATLVRNYLNAKYVIF